MNRSDDPAPASIVAKRYRLIRRIDAGGMGEVFEAEQLSTHRRVALKLMRNATDRPSARRRFEREAENLAKLQHLNIAQIFDAGEHTTDVSTTIPFIVMELVDCGVAITRWANDHALPIPARLALAATACDALQHAHSKHVVHRDCKPPNILVDSAGVVKLIDFGLSQTLKPAADGAHGETMLSDASLLHGTPDYMSPERFRQRVVFDDGSESQRAGTVADDIYATGVTLYQLCSGRLPFDRDRTGPAELAAFSRLIDETPVPSPRQFNDQISEDVETIILRCLAKEPTRRYSSAAAVADDLRSAIAGQSIRARRDGRAYIAYASSRSWCRRHPIIAAVAAAVIAATVAHSVGSRLDDAARERFERTVMTDRHLQHFDAARELSHVKMIAITPHADYDALAARFDLPKISTNPKALRALHGKLMQRLSDAHCDIRSLGFDIYFAGDSDPQIDNQFVAGAKALQQRGIAVVVASSGWDASANSQTIGNAMITGAATAQPSADRPWSNHLLRYRAGEPLKPSLNFAVAACAALHSTGPLQFEVLNGAVAAQTSAAHRVEFPITAMQAADADPAHAIASGDVVAHAFAEIPSDQALSAATVRYADVLGASDAQLHAWFDGRAVIVGDQRPGKDPTVDCIDGRKVFGAYGHLTAVEQLLEGKSIRYLPMMQIGSAIIDESYFVEFAVLALGVALGLRLFHRHTLRAAAVVATSASIVLASLLLYRVAGVLYNPAITLLTVAIACEFVAAARRFSRFHTSHGVQI